MNDRTCTIYGLSSSRDGELRYVGQTVQKPATRLRVHLESAKRNKTHIANWIKREVAGGYAILMEILEENASWNTAEIEWISKHKALGTRLLNHTDGGGGLLGLSVNKGRPQPWTSERNRSMKGIKTGHVISDAGKQRIAETQRARVGWTQSEEARKKIGSASRGKPKSEETKEKLRVKARARYLAFPEKFSMDSARAALPSKQPQEWKDKRAASLRARHKASKALIETA